MRRKKHMRLPNGFGSITFLTGNRRRPYWAKKFREWDERGYPQYTTIGYYPTYNEAYAALVEYNNSPYDIAVHNITFQEAAERWLKEYTEIPVNGKVPSQTTLVGYRAADARCEPIYDRRVREITASELQALIATVSAGSQHVFKAYLSNVFKWAVRNNIITASPVSYIYKTARENPKRNPFTVDEVRAIWKMDPSPIRDTALILLYSGMRVGELFTISKKTDRYIIAGLKTEAGRDRMIPIHSSIHQMVENMPKWKNPIQIYQEFVKAFPGHTPHDCRRTFITRTLECGMDQTVSRKIVGHASKDVHEGAYIMLNDVDYLCSQMELVRY